MQTKVFEILPLKWLPEKDTHKATGINHEYTVFESDEGVGVRWRDTINDGGDRRYGFTTREEAMDWVEDKHHPAQIAPWVKFIKGFKNETPKDV